MADPNRYGDSLRNSSTPLGSPLEGLLSCLSSSSSDDDDSNIGFPVSSPILMLTPPGSSSLKEENQPEGDAAEATPGISGVNQPDKLVTGDCTVNDSSGAAALRRETELRGFSNKREAEAKARVGSQAKVVIPFEPDASLCKLRRTLKSTLNACNNRSSPMKELKIGEKNVASDKSVHRSKSATAAVEIIKASDRNFGSVPARIRMISLEESGSPVTEQAQICQKNVVSAPAAETNIVPMNVCEGSFSSPSVQIQTGLLKSVEKSSSSTEAEPEIHERIVIPGIINKSISIEGLKSGAPAIGITNVSPQDPETNFSSDAARIRMRSLEESGSPVTEQAEIFQKNVVSASAAETDIVSMNVCEGSFSIPSVRIQTRLLKSVEKSGSSTEAEPEIHEQIVIPGIIDKAKSIEGLKSGAPAIRITNVSPQDPETNFSSDAARIRMRSLEESDSRVTEEDRLCKENVVVSAAALETNNVFVKACKASFSSSSAQIRTSPMKHSEKPDSPAEEAPGILKKKTNSGLVVTEVEDSQAKVSTKRKQELCADIISLTTNRAGKRSTVPVSDGSRHDSCHSGSRTDDDDEHRRRKISPKVALLLKVLKICAKDDECHLPKPETSTSLVEIAKMRGMAFP